jgi:hypothetical protein
VYRLLNPLSFVAFKMGRLRDGPSRTGAKGAYLDRYVTDEQRSSRPIFNATLRAAASWLFFLRRGGSTVMIQIAALRSRLEKSAAAEPAAKLNGFRRRYTRSNLRSFLMRFGHLFLLRNRKSYFGLAGGGCVAPNPSCAWRR